MKERHPKLSKAKSDWATAMIAQQYFRGRRKNKKGKTAGKGAGKGTGRKRVRAAAANADADADADADVDIDGADADGEEDADAEEAAAGGGAEAKDGRRVETADGKVVPRAHETSKKGKGVSRGKKDGSQLQVRS
jgi:predicted  nucleic acid-binding Zn-ribbon protein